MAVGKTIIKQDEIQVQKLKVDNITTDVQVNNTLSLNGEKSLSINSLSSGSVKIENHTGGTVNITHQSGGSVTIDMMYGGSSTTISSLQNAELICPSLAPPSSTTGKISIGTINAQSSVWVSDQTTLSAGDVRIACGTNGVMTGGHVQVGALSGTINGGKVTVGKMSKGQIIQEGINGGSLTVESMSGGSIKVKSVTDFDSYVEFDTFYFTDNLNARKVWVGRNDKHLSYAVADPGYIYIINARHGSNYTGIFFWDPDKGVGKSSAGMIINGWTSSDSNSAEHRQIIVEPCAGDGSLISDFDWSKASGFRMYLLNIEDSWHTGSGRGGRGVYTETVNGESSQCWSVWKLPIKMNLNGYANIT